MITQIKSMDQGHMLLIVVLVGALLWMFMKNHKGGVCSLFGRNKDTFIIGATGHLKRESSRGQATKGCDIRRKCDNGEDICCWRTRDERGRAVVECDDCGSF